MRARPPALACPRPHCYYSPNLRATIFSAQLPFLEANPQAPLTPSFSLISPRRLAFGLLWLKTQQAAAPGARRARAPQSVALRCTQ